MSIGTASNMEWLVGASNAQSVIRVDNIYSMTTAQTLVHTDDFDIIYDPVDSNKPVYLSSSTVATACVYMREMNVSYNQVYASTYTNQQIYGVPQYKQAYSGVSLANPVEVWSFSIGSASTMPRIPVREFTIFYTKDNVPHMTKMTLFCTWIIADNDKPVPDFMYAGISQI